MKEERKEYIQKLEADNLEKVGGGFTIPGQIANAFKAQMDAAAAVSQNTATAFCPTCGKNTEFTLFSGARARCNVCGSVRENL